MEPDDKEFSWEAPEGQSEVEFSYNDIFTLYPTARLERSCSPKFDKSDRNRELTFTTPLKTQRSSCLKSPFALSSLGESPWSSPQSSTPISGDISRDVSIAKSFETPSFHSPIILSGENRYLGGDSMRAEKMTSDTVLTWETNMETPSQHLSTSTDKVSSVGGGLSTPPRPLKSSQKATKKLFVSPDKRSDTKLSISSEQNYHFTENMSLKGSDRPEVPETAVNLEISENELDSKDFSLFSNQEDSLKEPDSITSGNNSDTIAPLLNQMRVPNDSEDEKPVPDLSEIEEKEGTKISSLENNVTNENSDAVQGEELIEKLKPDKNSQPSFIRPVSSDNAESLSITCNINSQDTSPAPKEKINFQYPTATQNDTQFQLDNQRDSDSLGFSQWPNEVYEHANKVLSKIDDGEVVSKKQNDDNNLVPAKLNSKDSLADGNQDSLAFSQWPNDVYDHLDKAISVLDNKENVHISHSSKQEIPHEKVDEKTKGKERKMPLSMVNESNEDEIVTHKATPQNQFKGFTSASNNAAALFAKGGFSDLKKSKNNQGESLKKSVNFFGEDFSDLDTSKVSTFTKASIPVNKPAPEAKDPISFFGEDLSDLDQTNLNKCGFQTASKVITSTIITTNKPKPSTSSPKVPTFTKASTPVNERAPKAKDPISFFGEDLSDLDQTNLNDGGFKTASKVITTVTTDKQEPSTSSLKVPTFTKASIPVNEPAPKAKDPISFFGEDLSDLDQTNFNDGGFKIASKVINAVTTDKQEPSTHSHPSFKFAGFSTASGRDVEFSAKSLNFVRSSQVAANKKTGGKQVSFTGVPDAIDETGSKTLNVEVPAKESSDTATETSAENSSSGSKSSQSPHIPLKPATMTGFSTAGGMPVGVSENSLNHIRSSQVPNLKALSGFSTASGVPVNITADSLAAVRCSQAPAKDTLNSGFSTAGGAPVKIQQDALDHIRSSQVPKPPGVATGFSTASGKGVSVCQESFDLIRSSQVTPVSIVQNKPRLSSSHSSKPHLKLKSSESTTPKPITPIFKTGSKPSLSIAQNSKRARETDQIKREDTPSDKVRRRQLSGSDESVISRVRRESTDDPSTPIQYLNKRRRISRRSGFNSPVTDKTRSCAVVSSPVSHRVRPGFSPLISSPKLESTIEECPAEGTSFITPYSKACPSTQPLPKKEVPSSMLWKQPTSLPTSSKLIKPGPLCSVRQSMLSLLPPRYYESEELFELGVSCGVEEVTAQTAQQFRFTKPDYFLENDGEEVMLSGCGINLKLRDGKSAGYSEFHQALLKAPKIKQQFISEEWVLNHYRLIVWKCAGLERCQPGVYAGRALTPENIMSQLLLRYSVEIDEGRRSALRRVTEKDDSPAKPMTLVVSGIGGKTIEVSDGWYCLECVLDNPLSVLIQSRAIKVGSKIVSFSSSIIGPHADGIPPLQAKATLKLKLNYNCVRPATWSAKLGYTDVNTMPSLQLSVLSADGGTCACIEVVVIRRYPVQFLETLPCGKKMFRSEKDERKRQEEYGRTRDKIIEDITHKLLKSEKAKRSKSISNEAVKRIDSGQELYDLIKNHPDPSSLQSLLNLSQREMLAEYTEKERSRQEDQHNKQLMEELKELCPPRKVISLVKHKIHCALQPNTKPYFLTIWRAEQQVPLKEGRCYKMYNISCGSFRGSGLTLSSSKSSLFRETKGDFTHMSAKPTCTVSSVPVSVSECDLVGKVLQTDRQTDTRTVLVIGDTETAGEVVMYSGGEEVKVGGVVCIVNLQVSKSGALICNEKSTLSSSPKDKTLSEKLSEFRKSIADKPQSFWDALLSSHSTTETTEPDHWDEVPDNIPWEQFEIHTNKHTNKQTNKHTEKQASNRDGTSVPLFSSMSELENEELLGCSDRAKSDYVTPVKPADYESIFG